jgi:HK97 family phage prohead protease
MNEQIETVSYEIKQAEWDDAGVLTGYASVKQVRDRAGDEIAPGAYLNLASLVEEGFGAVGHDLSRLPIATIEEATEDAHGLRVRMQFHTTEEAQAARTVVRERLKRAISCAPRRKDAAAGDSPASKSAKFPSSPCPRTRWPWSPA